MDPAILLPGMLGGPVGPYVRAPYLHDLRARDFSLVARTGQAVTPVRAGWANARDAAGNFALAVHSQPAWQALDLDRDGVREELGILLELQRTNLLTAPFPGAETVLLAAGTYTLQLWGSGSCALSGGPVGAATEGHPMVFTLDASTSVTFTLTGSAQAVQCELATFGTSPATGTRFISYLETAYNARPQAAIHYCRIQDRGTTQIAGARVWEIGTAGNRLYVDVSADTGRCRAVCETALGSVTSQVNSDLVLAYAPGVGPTFLTATRASTAVFASLEDTTQWPVRELLVVQLASGAVRLVESVDGGAAASGDTSAALAFPASGAYGAQTLRINADGAGGNLGAIAFLERRSIPWLADFDAMSDQQLMDFARRS